MLAPGFIFALWSTQLVLVVCARNEVLIRQATASTSTAIPAISPIAIAPSQNWDGPDGPWSSFTIRVGTPEQDVRVLISTASQQTWVILEKGCLPGAKVCSDARGGIFYPENSTTWSLHGAGYYELSLEQNLLNISANGLYGSDTLGLSLQRSDGPTLENQVIGGIAAEEFYLGIFGLNPRPTIFSVNESGQASYITSLREQNMVPSTSFGYTAGAPYRLKKVLASLTLGGYDQSRFIPNDLVFPFAPDSSRDLLVGVQSIIFKDQNGLTDNLLPSGIMAFVDSTVPQIWLPIEACQKFENAFGLTYDENLKVYPVNDTLHTALKTQNATISFNLGTSETGGRTIEIVLPYDSFDLQASPPFVQNSTRYFPLQRARNNTQYTLGRIFLQEAYLTVDWERGNFSLAQCSFVEGSRPELVAIKASSSLAKGENTASSRSSSSKSKTVGIAVGSTLAALVIVGGFIWLINIRRKKRKETRKNRAGKIIQTRKKSNDKSQQEDVKAELNTDNDHAIYELSGSRNSRRQTQLDVSSSLPSWIGDQPRYLRDRPGVEELNVGSTVPGLSQSDPLLGPHEMHGSLTTRIELAGDGPSEFHGSNPISLHTSSGRTSPVFRSTNQSPVPRSVGPSPASFHTLSTIPSSLHRLWSRRPLSQASTQEFVPSPPSATPLPSTHTAAAASSSSSQGNELPNPIPPTIEGSPSSSQAKHLSFLRGITESGH